MKEAELSGNDDELVSMYGWLVSMNPLGQMILSPLLGYLNTKAGSSRPAFLITGALFALGNVLYSILSVFPEDSRYTLILLSRFTVGCAVGKEIKIYL